MDGLAYLYYCLIWEEESSDRFSNNFSNNFSKDFSNNYGRLAIALFISLSLCSEMSPTLGMSTLGRDVWQLGDYGSAIVALQDRLKTAGCFPQSTHSTGYYGPITMASIKALQARHGIAVDGIFGRQTQGLLDGGKTCEAKASALELGSRGDRVRKLQVQLNNWGVPPQLGETLKVDGVFGWQTQKSVMRFQKLKDLKVDGIVDSETSERLWKPRLTAEEQRFLAEFQALAIWLCEPPESGNNLEHKRLREEILLSYWDLTVDWESWSGKWCQVDFDPQNPQNWGDVYPGYLGLP